MNSVQESKNELEAAIRYAENAISSANKTIESMEFRQEAAKKQYAEQTGREAALEQEVAELRDKVERLKSDRSGMQDCIKLRENQVGELNATIQFHIDREAGFLDQIKRLERELERQQVQGQGYYDSMRDCMAELEKLRKEKEASSGTCGCQAYRDLEEKVGDLKSEVNALEQPEQPTMPVIPKDVAIAIFREGVACGVSNACDELDNDAGITIEETEYAGDFEVSFSRWIDLSDHLDLDWMRDKVGDYDEKSVIEALKNLCADKGFECRIHGIDDQEEKKND